jgi:signal transduction histidine kinase
MKFGIRSKLIASYMLMVALPVLMVVVAGNGLSMKGGNVSQITIFNSADILVLIAALVIPFIFCACLLTWLISRSILTPLKALKSAANAIMEGNLDFTIEYRKNNEMGDFCAVFDLMRERLKESLEKQTAYERSRKELLASISHDLRTPMTSIKGYVEGLQDGIANDEVKRNRYFAVIKDKTEKLDKLIDDLFQFSQLELGHLEMSFKEQNSEEMLKAILSPIEMEFKDSGLNLTSKRPFPSVLVNADSDRIAQVFDNLLSNAKKFMAEQGEIEIDVKDDGDHITVAIKDNGPGISAEDLPHVFERFYRGEKSRSREFGGTGLGLAICKQIVEEHDGRIWAISQMGKGSTFYFTLPSYHI